MDQGTPAAATGQAGPAEPRWITSIADAVAVVVGLLGIGRQRAVVPGVGDLIAVVIRIGRIGNAVAVRIQIDHRGDRFDVVRRLRSPGARDR